MALQGTLDTFALADVLRLLASTRKSGRLSIDGDRGDGRVWFGEGKLVGGEGPADGRGVGVAEVVFHLLRSESGEFAFEADELPAEPIGPFEVDDVLAEAEGQVAEWQEIEAVVPAMSSFLTLRADLEDPERVVELTAADWRTVATIGSGTRVVELAEALDRSDLEMCRMVVELVGRDLLDVGETGEVPPLPAAADPVGDTESASTGAEAPEATGEETLDGDTDASDYFAEDGVSHTARARLDVLAAAYVENEAGAGNDDLRTLMPEPLPGAAIINGQFDGVAEPAPFFAQDDGAAAPDAELVPEATTGDDIADPAAPAPDDAADGADDPDLARQLSSLSPQAAAAIASAAGSLESSRQASARLGRRRTGSKAR